MLNKFDANSVMEVFQSLIKGTKSDALMPKSRLTIEHGLWANAFVRDESEIVVTTQLVKLMQDRSEIAFVIAHELSHIALRHSDSADTAAEIAADSLALQLMTAAGYNPRSADVVLERLARPLLASLVSISPRIQALRHQTNPVFSRRWVHIPETDLKRTPESADSSKEGKGIPQRRYS